jgi:hypothetical protein
MMRICSLLLLLSALTTAEAFVSPALRSAVRFRAFSMTLAEESDPSLDSDSCLSFL